jgi:molybdenum cofactor cytidylyltransferase
VSESWTDRLGLGARDLISFVGAGGKSTLMLTLGRELAGQGRRVVVTTTTKMSIDEVSSPVVDSIKGVEANLERRPGPVFVVRRGADDKVVGPAPTEIDRLFRESSADDVLVEADGAAGKSLKAPAQFEPVIPVSSTIVVVVAGIDAVGATITTSCHRPERVAELLGRPVTHVLTAADVAQVITSARGGLKDIPAAARVVVALTKVSSDSMDVAHQLSLSISRDPDINRVVVVPNR